MIPRAVRAHLEESSDIEVVLVGSTEALAAHAGNLPSESIGSFDGSLGSAGMISLRAIRRAVEMALAGEVSGILTGPVHKPALRAAGSHHPGQTELLGQLAGVSRVGMLMHAEMPRPLRILLATTHLPLREVPTALTSERLEDQTYLLAESLRTHWGIPSPRIALCAMNPHASDGGLFGDEEARIFLPAVRRLRDRGVTVTDPLPADTVFLQMLSGDADAVVSPYHDVGMSVFKTLAFGHGVNVTLGLPFVRTSPDHGTAFDLVGTGRADPTSSLEALRLAARLMAVGSSARL
ncbi:MAG: 4-hydroxythreonine-4-phosphate dehydrogenase PdxA [Gemmatimonadetes bacterium]|nr:4-hydroxythreonine-4-phosphate dehydrogenase PdxA [Gemmatimonadota bacterium]